MTEIKGYKVPESGAVLVTASPIPTSQLLFPYVFLLFVDCLDLVWEYPLAWITAISAKSQLRLDLNFK